MQAGKVRNKVDFTLAPEDLFLNPRVEAGMTLLETPEFIWRPVPPARISGFAASAFYGINAKLNGLIRSAERTRKFTRAVEYNSVPVLLEDARYVKSYKMSRDRLVLSGAAGARMLNRYRWENENGLFDPQERLSDYFARCQGEEGELPVLSGQLETDICFAVECRNTFNYYHFITESLSQLTVLDDLDFTGDIYFHFPNSEDKQLPFARKFVDALFPEFADRVFFERAPKDYDRVLTAYDLIGGHFQAPLSAVERINRFVQDPVREQGGITDLRARVALAVNSVNTALFKLRQRALAAIEGKDFSHLPKRFFVGRDSRQSRERQMEGEDTLFEHLKMFDFEYVVFESLEPLEQIALMAGAEMMVSYHGAGFTNMLFANPEAYVIEIGTIQTARFRWGDFWPLAHASGCRYINFFCDLRTETPETEPDFQRDGLVPVAMSDQAIGRVMAFVVSLLNQHPTFSTPATLSDLARELLTVGAPAQAVSLLENHSDLVARHVDLCLLQADCHKDLDEPKSELLALDRAHKADPSRWQTLVRMIWCANRCERPQVIRWALSRLKADFPERHDAFVSNHEWVRYVA